MCNNYLDESMILFKKIDKLNASFKMKQFLKWEQESIFKIYSSFIMKNEYKEKCWIIIIFLKLIHQYGIQK
jgi:hypothetical protein